MLLRSVIALGPLACACALISPGASLGQTATSTNCYVIGATEHCDSQTTAPPLSSGVHFDFGLLKPPDFVGSYVNGYAAGQALAGRREADRRVALLLQEMDERDAARRQAAAQTAEAATQLAQARAEIHLLRLQKSFDRSDRIGRLSHEGRCAEARAVAQEDPQDLNENVLNAMTDEFCPVRPSTAPSKQ